MYFRILKRDLKRKKTMNAILLIFIILASTFISGSVNNMVSVVTALDRYFDRAEVPDYWIGMTDEAEFRRLEDFTAEHQYEMRVQELLQVDPNEVTVNGDKFEYSQTTGISALKGGCRIFDRNDEELTSIDEGEIYLTGELFCSSPNEFQIGDTIEITVNGRTKSFTLAGSSKDALFGSAMMGITRFLISEKDYEELAGETSGGILYSVCIYTDDGRFADNFNDLELNCIMNNDRSVIKTMYIMDMITAAVLLIVSVCLILISMVILRFTIQFTMSEEFREIGVMKAIGIRNRKIRGLYLVKYFAISAAGALAGLVCSIPFGNLMLGKLSRNIIMSGDGFRYLNVICAAAVAAAVVLFCYFCTRKIRTFSPVDAIRNGERGERYRRKSFLSLSWSGLPPVCFLAVNDILSDIRRFAAMLLIFILGLLLIDIPVNTINTVQSDQLITWFSMAECDHVVCEEMIMNENSSSRELVEKHLKEIRDVLSEHGMEAEIFQEVMFRMNISHNGKKRSSLAFQGAGDVSADMYSYLKGSPPRNKNEVAISHIIADSIDAGIGDTVEIKNGGEKKEYMVTAIFQTMNNMGEGIRFYEEEELDYRYAGGSFGIQVIYQDAPNEEILQERQAELQKLFPDSKIYTAGEYVNFMIGDVAGQFQGMKYLILTVVLCINVLVTVLMVKSFITKEKGEIAVLKAVGFRNSSLIGWQALRIGIILFLSVVMGTLLSSPLSEVTSGKIFQFMGAANIRFDIVPLEVYVIYPSILLGVTVLACVLASLQIRKIEATETSNIE